MILTRRYILALLVMFGVRTVRAQSLNGNVLRLTPTTVPATCNTGDLRVDQNASYALKLCVANVWSSFAGALPTYTASQVLFGNGSNVPSAVPGFTFDTSTTAGSIGGNFTASQFIGNLIGTASQAGTASGINFTVPVIQGGTGRASLTNHGVLIGAGTAAITQSSVGGTGTALIGSTGADPTFSAIMTLGQALGTTGQVVFVGSSSGAVSLRVQDDAGTYNYNFPVSSGSIGQVLLSQGGAGQAQQWVDMSQANITAGITPIARGGTNNTTLSIVNGGVLYTDGTRVMNSGAGTAGQVLQSNGAAAPTWVPAVAATTTPANLLLNAANDWWQNGTAVNVTSTGGGTPATVTGYGPDQWMLSHRLGASTTAAVITMRQTTGALTGSIFGLSVTVSVAPGGTAGNTFFHVIQTLSNKASIQAYNQTVTFSVPIKAFGNVNKVSCDLLYSTTEVLASLALGTGTAATVSVNTASFTTCSVTQAVGTSPTLSGVIGVRVSVANAAVSSGNNYDVGNGFVVEQAMLNMGASAQTFVRQNQNPATEFTALQYFFEKSLNSDVAPGAITASAGAIGYIPPANVGQIPVLFKTTKMKIPIVTLRSYNSGSASKCYDFASSVDLACTANFVGMSGFGIAGTTTANHSMATHFDADARF